MTPPVGGRNLVPLRLSVPVEPNVGGCRSRVRPVPPLPVAVEHGVGGVGARHGGVEGAPVSYPGLLVEHVPAEGSLLLPAALDPKNGSVPLHGLHEPLLLVGLAEVRLAPVAAPLRRELAARHAVAHEPVYQEAARTRMGLAH